MTTPTELQSHYLKWVTTFTTVEEMARYLQTNDLEHAQQVIDAGRRAHQAAVRQKAHAVSKNDGYDSAMKAISKRAREK